MHIWGLGCPVQSPRDYGTEPDLAKTLPTALTTMWPIVWVAGSPDILSLTGPPSLIINPSTPGGCRSCHTLSLADRQQPVFTVLQPPPLSLFLLLPPYPYPCPHGIAFWNTIPQVYSTKATDKLSLDTVAFSQLPSLSWALPVFGVSSQTGCSTWPLPHHVEFLYH